MQRLSPSAGTSRRWLAGKLAVLVVATAVAALVFAGAAAAVTGNVITGSGWAQRYAPQSFEEFLDVAMADARPCLGRRRRSARSPSVGVVIATTDGGATWREEPLRTAASFDGVASVDAGHCWVVGRTVVDWSTEQCHLRHERRRRDLGAAAHRLPHRPHCPRFQRRVARPRRGHRRDHPVHIQRRSRLVHASARQRRESDRRRLPGRAPRRAVSATSPSGGEVGGAIFATGDGGLSWHTEVLDVPAGFTGVSFADATHGWAVTRSGGPTGPRTAARVGVWGRSRRTGSRSRTSTSRTRRTAGPWAARLGLRAGWGRSSGRRSDGGDSWRPQTHTGSEYVDLAIAFADSLHGCVVGPMSGLTTTANGGKPLLFLRLRGLKNRAIQLGDRVAALGVVHPPLPTDGKVRLQVFRQMRGGGWAAVEAHVVTLRGTGPSTGGTGPRQGQLRDQGARPPDPRRVGFVELALLLGEMRFPWALPPSITSSGPDFPPRDAVITAGSYPPSCLDRPFPPGARCLAAPSFRMPLATTAPSLLGLHALGRNRDVRSRLDSKSLWSQGSQRGVGRLVWLPHRGSVPSQVRATRIRMRGASSFTA